jgi:geranylgeranyl diphosphate synthase, type I
MTSDRYFRLTKRRLLEDLEQFLFSKRGEMSRLKPWGNDVIRRLKRFTGKGKMIRGGLVCLGYEMAGRRLATSAVRAGTALELIQSALLIHDDIMDKDVRRRGEPSVHEQYARLADRNGLEGAAHFGLSMGICAGEIAIFLAFEALAGLSGPPERTVEVQKLFAAEFGLVGLGQMRDIEAGASARTLSERDVLDLYRFKTARYSFSLPLVAGWSLAGGKPSVRGLLGRLGEYLGLVFQIKDDELGLFGDEKVLGKPVGSDIRQGKKTLIYLRLLDKASPVERKKLAAIFGLPDASERDIFYVRNLAVRHGIDGAIRRSMEGYARRARRLIGELPVKAVCREILDNLLDFSLTRKS